MNSFITLPWKIQREKFSGGKYRSFTAQVMVAKVNLIGGSLKMSTTSWTDGAYSETPGPMVPLVVSD